MHIGKHSFHPLSKELLFATETDRYKKPQQTKYSKQKVIWYLVPLSTTQFLHLRLEDH